MGWAPLDGVLCWAVKLGCIYQPPDLIDTKWGYLLFFGLCFADVFVIIMLISTVGGFVTRLHEMRRTKRELAALHKVPSELPSLTILVPCYLPNEQPILKETIAHIMGRLEYGRDFTLIICYNTPHPLPIEADLAKMDGQLFPALEGARDGICLSAMPSPPPSSRLLRIVKVKDSQSKAENLNAALALVDTENVVIYDADHHPDPGSLELLTAHLRARRCECVQGSTYLRHKHSLFDVYINTEFFVTHFVFFPAMQFLTSCGVFGGSNALWKTEALRDYSFRHDVQTEDIELSTQAMLRKVRIRFCPDARSGELPPATFIALYRQRLRWAVGWDQVTIQHFHGIGSSDLSCREKAALYWILPMRWALLFSATLNAIVTPVVGLGYKLQVPGASLGLPIDSCISLAGVAFLSVTGVVLASAVLHEPPHRWLAVLLFQVTGIMYISWQLLLAVISLSKVCIGADGGWIVTTRAAPERLSRKSRSNSQFQQPSNEDFKYYRLK
ncbi:hypothetical protein AB1Y20_012356 [Prymnesium parvum]|uniref:Ceramide glucosyltransferase n=1 Tax=Prymnesium parvum TaxID=97485 RepID=A0AB34IRK8_PRYPA